MGNGYFDKPIAVEGEPEGLEYENTWAVYTPHVIGWEGKAAGHEVHIPCPYCGRRQLYFQNDRKFYCTTCGVTWQWELRLKHLEAACDFKV